MFEQRDKSILNVVVDEKSFRRIEDGRQKVVFEYRWGAASVWMALCAPT